MQIFDCRVHQLTRGVALVFALYLMYHYRSKKTHPIFIGGTVMGAFDLYTWWNTACNV